MTQKVRAAGLLAVGLLLTACTTAPTGNTQAPAESLASPAPSAENSPSTAAAGPAGAAGAPQQDAGPVTVSEPRDVTTGLEAPWSVVFTGDTALISERDSGRILELVADGSTREIGTVAGVAPEGESGLLGLAVDDEQRLYAFSTAAHENRVQRFVLEGAPGTYALGAAETILDGLPVRDFHSGGRIAFGPDGMLYVAVGDTGDERSAQQPAALTGKILRMTPDGEVPGDNPEPGSLVYSSGHRNVQGMAWSADGTMFATEFGQDTWDELNVIVPGGNYGWPEVEGITGEEPFIDPVQQWSPAEASPSGLTVIDETLVVANLRGSVLRTVPVADPAASAEHFAGELGRLRDVVPAPDGSLWILTNNTDGRGEPRDGDDRILAVDLTR